MLDLDIAIQEKWSDEEDVLVMSYSVWFEETGEEDVKLFVENMVPGNLGDENVEFFFKISSKCRLEFRKTG